MRSPMSVSTTLMPSLPRAAVRPISLERLDFDFTSSFSPLISWYQTPGTSMMAMCPCADLAHQTISQLIHMQLYGAAIGAVLAIIIGAVVRSRRHKKAVVTVENH